MENQSSNFYFLKIAICSILLYLNIGSIISILEIIVKIIITLTLPDFWAFIISSIFFVSLKCAVLIGLFSYFLKHLEYIVNLKKINSVLLVNLIIFPIAMVISFGSGLALNYIMSRTIDLQIYGELAKYGSFLSIGTNILNMLMLTVFGILALSKKVESEKDIQIK